MGQGRYTAPPAEITHLFESNELWGGAKEHSQGYPEAIYGDELTAELKPFFGNDLDLYGNFTALWLRIEKLKLFISLRSGGQYQPESPPPLTLLLRTTSGFLGLYDRRAG